MTSQVSFKAAARVGVIAASFELFNQGSPLGALFLGMAGNLLIEGATRLYKRVIPSRPVINQMLPTPLSRSKPPYGFYLLHEFEFKIAPRINSDIQPDERALEDAIDQIREDYRTELEKFLKFARVDPSSREEIIKYFTTLLSEGTCAGAANALFDKIIRNESSSLKESAVLVKKKDLFYHQILSHIRTSIICYIQANYNVRKKEIALLNEKERREGENNLKLIKKEQNITCLREVNRKYHIGTFAKSKKFPVFSSAEEYQNAWETAMRSFPRSQNFVGVFDLPNHVLTVQYGPQGYVLYDSRSENKGLFVYPDAKTFFRELRYHILADVHGHFFDKIQEKGIPKLRKKMLEEAEDLMHNQRIHFLIHPL